MKQIVHVGTSKVRLIEGHNKSDRGSELERPHKNKPRGDEGCSKGQNVEFMTYRNTEVFSLQHCCWHPKGWFKGSAAQTNTQVTGGRDKNRVFKMMSSSEVTQLRSLPRSSEFPKSLVIEGLNIKVKCFADARNILYSYF